MQHITRHMDINTYRKRHFGGAFLQTWKRNISLIGALILIIANYYFIGCPIRFLSGIPCLGCGMTRAWIQVLHGNIRTAFYFHPLWLCPPLFVLLYLFLRPKYRRAYDFFAILFSCLFVAAYGIRVYMHNPIVAINLHDGLIYKAFDFIKAFVLQSGFLS